MIDRTTKLRWRRTVRQSRRQVQDIGLQAEEHLDRHFFSRVERLIDVRRFVASWVLLVVCLIGMLVLQVRALEGYYTTLQPVPGGYYTEGAVGSFTDANPLYATGLVDSSVAKLVFASLLKIDPNGNLTGDLARKWVTDDRNVQYTVTLRDNLTWHDGRPLTADDVVFTYRTIQNPDAKSPLFGSWQGIKIEAPNPHTVVFTLPSALASFPYSLTNGIVPKHVLETVPATQLRSARFNTVDPVGAGPFMWNRVEVSGNSPETREEKVGLKPFPNYYAGKPKLDQFVLRSFHDTKHLIDSFKNNELDAVVGLENVPDELRNRNNIVDYNVPLMGEVTVFLKTTSETFKDVKVRQAAVQSVDIPSIINSLGYPVASANQPLLKRQLGYDKSVPQLPRDITTANRLLDEAGWAKAADGMRYKNNKPLTFTLVSQNTVEYTKVSQRLQEQWKQIGMKVEVVLQQSSDFQGVISRHDYDALLYAIAIGPDPDVFAYWHSSQADPRAANRLNFSEYKSATADKALEAGRSRSDATLRTVKYKPFLESWRNDAPAVVLYQPRFLYISRGKVHNFTPRSLNDASDRFSNVSDWMIRQQKLPES